MNSMLKLAAVAALALAIGIGVGPLLPSNQIGTAGPSAVPSPTASPAALAWRPASFQQDWPGPLRPEPAGGSIVVPAEGQFTDATGDIGPVDRPWLDIAEVTFNNVDSGLAYPARVVIVAPIPLALVESSEQWIAYGLVFDTDGDGVPEMRVGADNLPVSEPPGSRAWRTDLDTGRTIASVGSGSLVGDDGTLFGSSFFPGDFFSADADRFARFSVKQPPDATSVRFYAWASLIEDGQVVATDYAPDAGWLEWSP